MSKYWVPGRGPAPTGGDPRMIQIHSESYARATPTPGFPAVLVLNASPQISVPPVDVPGNEKFTENAIPSLHTFPGASQSPNGFDPTPLHDGLDAVRHGISDDCVMVASSVPGCAVPLELSTL